MEMPADIESVQVPTYFFFAGSQAEVPWPWKGAPAITLLKSLIRHSPPHPIVLVSVPWLVIGGAPGMNISTVASQVPASISKILCSGPGFGIGMSCATAEPVRTRAPATRASAARVRFWTFIVTSCEN